MSKSNDQLHLSNNKYNSNSEVKLHYQRHPYPNYPLIASVRKIDTYALNVPSLWCYFNCKYLDINANILLAGCGSFSPYPTAIANENANIWALDLSKKNLNRARLHCLLHKKFFNIKYIEEDIINFNYKPAFFHFIDCYGVIHHIADDEKALKNIYNSLVDEGIARLMVYSKGIRRKIECIRKAFRILKIDQLWMIKDLIVKAKNKKRKKHDSLFLQLIEKCYETKFDSGIADMFLHPYARTYSIDELLNLISKCGFIPLRFIHTDAIADVDEEIKRLKDLEKNNNLSDNFILYIGKKIRTSYTYNYLNRNNLQQKQQKKQNHTVDTYITLNPVIKKHLNFFSPFELSLPGKFFENLNLNFKQKILLRPFKRPRKKSELTNILCKKNLKKDLKEINNFLQALLLIEYESDV